jgi:hypothetical protein
MIDVRSKLRFFGRSKNIKMLIARISKKGFAFSNSRKKLLLYMKNRK